MNIYSEKSIAGALQRNTCPLCGHHYMAGETQGKKHYIGCYVCMTRWEIQKATFDDVVRLCDTKTWKQNNGWQHLPIEGLEQED